MLASLTELADSTKRTITLVASLLRHTSSTIRAVMSNCVTRVVPECTYWPKPSISAKTSKTNCICQYFCSTLYTQPSVKLYMKYKPPICKQTLARRVKSLLFKFIPLPLFVLFIFHYILFIPKQTIKY